jgi:HAD superfamily hydrolase (TIGR01549 family)
MLEALSFDFWNTLYADGAEDQRRNLRKEYFAALINLYGNFGPADIEQAFTAGSNLFLENWIHHYRTPTAAERLRFMAQSLGISLKESHVQEATDYFGQMIFEIQPREIEHVKELLPQLAKKYPLGIISDTGYITGEYIRKFLNKENLLKHFSSLVFSDENEHSKPHESVFQKTAEKLGVETKKLMHIGDLERTDVAGAENSGCISVKFTGVHNDTSQNGRAQFVISSYRELPDIISVGS